MKRVHDNGTCDLHWRLGSLSSVKPWACHKGNCKCACHANGVEALLNFLAKLGFKSARRYTPWDYEWFNNMPHKPGTEEY